MKLYVFNPDTDMALANNEENYIAPASARRMAQDLLYYPSGMPSLAVPYSLHQLIMQIICK